MKPIHAIQIKPRLVDWLKRECCRVARGGWQEAERAYQLWKARQVADQQGSGAVAVEEGEARKALVDFAVHRLNGDLFSELVDYMWEGGCPQGLTPVAGGRTGFRRWAWSVAARVRRSCSKQRDAVASKAAV
jgi:hypothetical protein